MRDYKLVNNYMSGEIDSLTLTIDSGHKQSIPLVADNTEYQNYLEDIKTHGMSIVTCTDCGDGAPNDSMWQYLDNAEQLVIDKYGSDSDKLTALREHRYVKAMKAEFPYESMTDAGPIIDSTSKEIKQKYNLPMRR